MAIRRTTIEIDEDLLTRAKQALGLDTARSTVEEALRQAAQRAEAEFSDRAERQRRLLKRLPKLVDVDVLASEEMWRKGVVAGQERRHPGGRTTCRSSSG